MAFFGVTLEKIDKVWDHPQADRLSLAKVEGLDFQFVIGKDSFKPGDEVLYFPIDSVLPLDLIKKLNMEGKFAGKEKNRIKTLKLRGEISQGFVCPPLKVISEKDKSLSPEKLTELLGVTKYEPPIQFSSVGILKPLPSGFSVYDIEGCDRNPEVVNLLLEKQVLVTEKMEGTNFSIGKSEGKVIVNQRNFTIEERDDVRNFYWEAARLNSLVELAEVLPNDSAIYGELCGPGIQKNIYNLKDLTIFVFDIKIKGKWLSVEEFKKYVKTHNLKIAPIIFEGVLKDYLKGKTVQEVSNGKSVVAEVLREGIVIKPKIEEFNSKIGRLIIKQRSPEYLVAFS